MTELEVQALPGGMGFALGGELDMASAGSLVSHADDVPAHCDIVLDLSGVTFMDSSGLRAILQLVHRRAGGAVVLRNVTSAVKRVFDLALPRGMPGLRIDGEYASHG